MTKDSGAVGTQLGHASATPTCDRTAVPGPSSAGERELLAGQDEGRVGADDVGVVRVQLLPGLPVRGGDRGQRAAGNDGVVLGAACRPPGAAIPGSDARIDA
jgi:hypothetical protein